MTGNQDRFQKISRGNLSGVSCKRLEDLNAMRNQWMDFICEPKKKKSKTIHREEKKKRRFIERNGRKWISC